MSAKIELHSCYISRKGKGARGMVKVSTIGKPIEEKGRATVKAWDWSIAENYKTDDLLSELEKLGSVNILLAQIRDITANKEAIQGLGETAVLGNTILQNGLSTDYAHGKAIAYQWLSTIRTMKAMNAVNPAIKVPTIEELMAGQKVIVAGLKKQGLWGKEEKVAKKAPKLITRKNKAIEAIVADMGGKTE